jgi:hypothetical protein
MDPSPRNSMTPQTQASSETSVDARHATRHAIHVTVDVKALRTQDVDNILFGQGFQDLNLNSLSMSRPRHGMERGQTLDLSCSGLRLSGIDLKPGTAAILDLHLPEDKVVVKALVEVVWTSLQGEMPTAGCRFAAIQEFGAERMMCYLREKN